MASFGTHAPVRIIGRYALFDEIAAGGMATVHLGRLIGPVGFSRTVAIKRLHAHFARDPDFSAGFVDEARLAARIHHPNVVSIVDVLAQDGELSLVMDYVEGDSLAGLLRQAIEYEETLPLPVVSAIICGSLYGLHAAHEARSEQGEPLTIVHRDVSPQNILVGTDGVPRIVDFGIAKAAQRLQTTADGQIKGKIAYMAPEQIRLAEVSRQTDIYAIGIVLWEALAGRRLFKSENQAHLMTMIMEGEIAPVSEVRTDCPPHVDAVLARALNRDPGLRYRTAREMATELSRAIAPAPPTDVGDWVIELASSGFRTRREIIKHVESVSLDAIELSASAPHHSGPPERPKLSVDDATRIERPNFSPGVREETGTVTATVTGLMKSRSGLLPVLLVGFLLLCGAALGVWGLSDDVDSSGELPGQAGRALPEDSLTEVRSPEGAAQETSPDEDAATRRGEGTSAERDAASSEGELPKGAPPQANAVGVQGNSKTPSSLEGSARVAPKQKAPAPAATPKKAENSAKSAAECPKYYIDADGIRRINRKCW